MHLKHFLPFFFISFSFAQSAVHKLSIDSLYREDQLYISGHLIALKNKPEGMAQNKISSGFSVGFLRDMPFTKSRRWAVGLGLGYAYQKLNHNLKITNNDTYGIINEDFESNSLTLQYAEIPLEIRWRNSTPESHIFWRIYTGFKVSYLLRSESKFSAETQNISLKNNPNIRKFQTGVYLSAGQNTWNGYVFYGLQPLFQKAFIGDKSLEINQLQIGLMFYIL